MIPHKQLIEHNPAIGDYGDCHRTCVASILNIQPSDVPHFCRAVPCEDGLEVNPKWALEEREFLAEHGLAKACFYFPASETVGLPEILHTTKELSSGVPLILGGRSSLGCNHSVVIMDGTIVSDPSGNGIVGPCDDGLYWVEIISVANAFSLAVAA